MNWIRSNTSYRCDVCSFSLFKPIAETDTLALGLYDDDRYPGRSILVLKEHYDHLEDVDYELAREFLMSMTFVGLTMRDLELCRRVNYAVFGNEHPHVHAHIIPRKPESDPVPNRPIWENPISAKSLNSGNADRLISRIAEKLVQSSRLGVIDSK
jgi:diadenosine tetraphosphate (Ap4A) HIT family hydrolase